MNTLQRLALSMGMTGTDRATTEYMVGYMTGFYSAIEVQEALHHQEGYHGINLRRVLMDSGEALNLKLWLISDCPPSMFGVHRRDWRIRQGLTPKLQRYLNGLRRKYGAPTPEETNKIIEDVIVHNQKVSVFIRRFAYRKLRFIAQYNGTTLEDIFAELQQAGIRALLHKMPRYDTTLHAINHVKRSIHNHGINMIKAATRAKSAGIRQTSGGFEMLKLSWDMPWVDTGYTEEDLAKDVSIWRSQCTPRQQKLVQMLMDGSPVEEAIQVLGIESDKIDKVYTFIERMRDQFRDYAEVV